MLIHINGLPGVGKLTIARRLAELVNGRLLDNHSVYNVAFALTTPKTEAFYDTVRALREIAYDRACQLDPEVPLVLTNAHFEDSAWGQECWDAAIELARRRKVKLYVVVLSCASEEHAGRMRGRERAGKRKPQDIDFFAGKLDGRRLIDRGGDHLLHFDSTGMSPAESAAALAAWLAEP